MKREIILAGVGGQGLLALAAVITRAAQNEGLCVKQAGVHGMAQRGGTVESHIRLSNREVYSPLIREGTADLILALEPMEGLRQIRFLSPEGGFVASSAPFVNIPNYPPIERVLEEIEKIENHRLIDAPAIARKIGSPRAANMVLLGAAFPFLKLSEEALIEGIESVFAGRLSEEMISSNIAAFRRGLAEAG